MMIELACPRCDRSLSLPDEQRGKYAVCKHCEGHIWVPEEELSAANKEGEETATLPHTHTSPTTEDRQTLRANNNLVSSNNPETPALPESTQTPLPPAGSPSNPPKSPAEYQPTDKSPPPPHPIPPPQPTEGQISRHSSRHYAELITEKPAQSQLEPASDGQLPKLALESKGGDKSAEKKAESNRLITFGVICASLLASSILLLIETTPSVNSQADTTEQTLATIHERYFGPEDGPWIRYQLYLRDAALARSQGDSQKEERYYRKVLHLLNAQHLDKTDQGVTGLRRKSSNSSLKSDQELQELLSRLLKQRTN